MPSCFLIYWSRIQMIGLVHNTYKPYTLVGPTVTRPVQDPLAVLCFKNRQKWQFYFCSVMIANDGRQNGSNSEHQNVW